MKSIKVLEESNKYLISISDYIYRLSTQYSVDKNDRDLLEHYADDLMDIQKKLEVMKNNWMLKENSNNKIVEVSSELEYKYKTQKRITENKRIAEAVAKRKLDEIKKSGTINEIDKAQDYVKELNWQYIVARQEEDKLKREFEQFKQGAY